MIQVIGTVLGTLIVVITSFAYSKSLRSWWFGKLWLKVQHTCDLAIKERKQEFLDSLEISGSILDVGSGAGVQLHYIASLPKVTEIVCVEPNTSFKTALENEILIAVNSRPKSLPPIKITAFYGTAEEYLSNNERKLREFDIITCFLVLCSIPEPEPVLKHLHDKCLVKNGRLIFIEHVCPPKPGITFELFRFIQPLYGLFSDGCHLCRTTVESVNSAGDWQSVSSSIYYSKRMTIPLPFAFGVATKK